MRNTTKFGSPKLDLYNSTYDFPNLHAKTKINELSFFLNWVTAKQQNEKQRTARDHRTSTGLADDGLSGDGLSTKSIPTTSRTH